MGVLASRLMACLGFTGVRSGHPGQILAIAAVALVVLFSLVGAGLDYGLAIREVQHLQNAADAASLAAADALVYGPSPGIPAAQATATEYLRLHNYQQGVDGTSISFVLATPTPTGSSHTIEIQITRSRPSALIRVAGINDLNLTARAAARLTSGGVQDIVGSIPEPATMSAADLTELRDAVRALVDQLVPVSGNPRGAKIAITQFQGEVCPANQIWAWGANAPGQLGDGSTTNRASPVSVTVSGATGVAAGGSHSLMATSTGAFRVWAWGANGSGQLGDGTTNNRSTPGTVPLGQPEAIAAGGGHSVTWLGVGTYPVQVWGENSFGQLGDGSTTNRLEPQALVPALSNPIAIAAGTGHTLALLGTGTYRVRAWGDNSSGQLGDGSTTAWLSPVQVSLPGVMTAVAAGGSHSLALDSTGAVWAWGANLFGQLGDGTVVNRAFPVQVQGGLSNVVAIAAGGSHSLALDRNDRVWAWGANGSGQVGNGTVVNAPLPVQVPNPVRNIVAVTAGGNHSLALEDNGDLWAWGLNTSGQLGDGTTTIRLSPVQVAGIPAIKAIAAGANHTLALPQAPCLRDAHVLQELTNDRGRIFSVIDGPSSNCPPFPPQPPSTTPVNPPAPTAYGCPLKAVGGSGRYIKNGFEVAFIRGLWDLWDPAKGGRTGARKILILVTDGANQVAGMDQGTADSNTEVAARRLEAGPDRSRRTADDVEIYVVGFFGSGESAFTATTPPGCPSSSGIPPGRTDLDNTLIVASSSSAGTCDHYYPVVKGGGLKAAFTAIGAGLVRAQLAG